MFCCKEKKQSSSLPPKCYHRKPELFRCPSYGCLPPEPTLPRARHCCSPSYPLLTDQEFCRSRPKIPSRPPTICIAGPCPQVSDSKLYCPPSAPKIMLPSSCVRFCIRFAKEGSTYYPCYYSNLPNCPSSLC